MVKTKAEKRSERRKFRLDNLAVPVGKYGAIVAGLAGLGFRGPEWRVLQKTPLSKTGSDGTVDKNEDKMPDQSLCTCGHYIEDHGHDPKYPGSTACTFDGCNCIAFDAE